MILRLAQGISFGFLVAVTLTAQTTPPNSQGNPSNNGTYFATNYPGVHRNTEAVFDAVCSNGSNVITSATAHFTTLANIHLNETMWVVNPGIGGGPVVPKTTILSIDSDSQIHSTANGTANCGSGLVLIWGDDDRAGLNGAWDHLLNDSLMCGTMQLPAGGDGMMVSGAIFNKLPIGGTASPCTAGLILPTITGVAWGGTWFAPTPDFDFSTCSGPGLDSSCVGIGYAELANFNWLGFGLGTTTNAPNTAATLFHVHSPNMMYNVSCQNWAQNDPNLINVLSDFSLNYFQFGQFFACGGQGPIFSSGDIAGPVIGSYAGAGNTQPLLIQSGPPGRDYFSNWFNGGASGPCYIIATGWGHLFGEAIPSNSTGGTLCVQGGTISITGGVYTHTQAIAGRSAVTISSSGRVIACDARFTDTGTGEFAIVIDATSTFEDCGSNAFNGIINIAPGGVWIGPSANNGSCTGTASSSVSAPGIGLYGLGQNTTPACTSTTTNLGVPARKAGTITGLTCTASHAGVNSSSGVCTVLVNNVASSVTCTIGTTTGCQDATHSQAVNSQDILSVGVTTQSGEVLAGVKAQFILE